MAAQALNVPVSRYFLLVGTGFLIVGLGIGMYMGASGNHALAASHAHINLVGFVLSAVFALTYKSYPAMAESVSARIHLWLHALGALALNAMLFLLLAGVISEAAMVPVAPISEIMVAAGVLIFASLVVRQAD